MTPVSGSLTKRTGDPYSSYWQTMIQRQAVMQSHDFIPKPHPEANGVS